MQHEENLIGKRAWIGNSSPAPHDAVGHGIITSQEGSRVSIYGDDGESRTANTADVFIVPHQKHAVNLILAERQRQDDKWGDQSGHPPGLWLAILMEEVGEVAKANLEDNDREYEKELVQVASVAVAALESYYIQKEQRMKQGYEAVGDRIINILRQNPDGEVSE